MVAKARRIADVFFMADVRRRRSALSGYKRR
jgi:hypothetical protein